MEVSDLPPLPVRADIFFSKLLNMINNGILDHATVALIIRFSAIISKILVTPVTMVLNFFVMKGVIEKI
jgi:hypothetical protein